MSSTVTPIPLCRDQSTSFIGDLQASVNKNHDKVFVSWYNSNGKCTSSYTYQKLWDEAGFISHYLHVKLGIVKGDAVILCYTPGLQFFAAFLGCLRAGIVAIPIYPPHPKNLAKGMEKMDLVLKDSCAKLVMGDNSVHKLIMLAKMKKSVSFSTFRKVDFKVHPKIPKAKKTQQLCYDEQTLADDDIAFLQYTSGSTGDPKGVMISFQALGANTKLIVSDVHELFKRWNKPDEDIVGFSWLPQYHDMGLIWATIAPMIGGWNCNMISPLDFLANPLLWIKLMSELKVNSTQAPNFAYRLVARKFKALKEKDPSYGDGLDLSRLTSCGCAAEPIQIDTKEIFESTFSDLGVKPNSFLAGYGLAESVVYVGSLPDFRISSGNGFVAVISRNDHRDGQAVKIVCPKTLHELPDGEVGEIWVSSPSVAKGYFNKPELTAEVFGAEIESSTETDRKYLRTGDLGFYEDDCLFVCGREKDVIIVNGKNYYPNDVEYEVHGTSEGVREGCVAAFSSDESGAGSGELEIIFEIRKSHENDCEQIISAIRKAVSKNIGLPPSRIVAIKERSILKTTSGKIRRRKNREALHGGYFEKYTVFDFTKNSVGQSNLKESPGNTSDKSDAGTNNVFEATVQQFFGNGIDANSTWDELGMTSIVSVQLRDAISDSMQCNLDLDCFDTYPTPASLKAFVQNSKSLPLEISPSKLPSISSTHVPWIAMSILQAIGSTFILFVFSLGILLAFSFGSILNESMLSTTGMWIVIPLMIPVWMVVISLILVALKWCVVWQYREGEVKTQTIAYFRWWIVDRALDLWETWVGRFVLGTPLVNVFYLLMGAKIHRSVCIEAFIREFDLVTIGKNSEIKSAIFCRKFGAWNKNDDATLRFRKVIISNSCNIDGVVSPGVLVGEASSVDDLACVHESAQVPPMTLVQSNPAAIVPGVVPKPSAPHCWWKVGGLKCLWLILEMYHFFAVIALGDYVWASKFPSDWRYGLVLKWILIFVWTSYASVLSSIAIKWILIGKRRPGFRRKSILRKVADDMTDWHYSNLGSLAHILSTNSRLWNVLLMLHGMDVDFASKLFPDLFSPSTMDLITIRNSFISVVNFDTASDDKYEHIKVIGSSLGIWCKLSQGSSVENKIVPPMTKICNKHIAGSDDLDERNVISSVRCWELAMKEICLFFLSILNVGMLFGSVVPSYEFWMLVSPQTLGGAAITLGLCVIVQAFACSILLSAYQWVTFVGAEERGEPWSTVLYSSYQSADSIFLYYTLASVLKGSPLYNALLRILGSTFEGRAILFPHTFHEPCLLTFADKSIVDASHIDGHFAVYGKLSTGRCRIAGTVHRGTNAANAYLNKEESGPCRAYIGTYDTTLASTERDCSNKSGKKLLDTTATTKIDDSLMKSDHNDIKTVELGEV